MILKENHGSATQQWPPQKWSAQIVHAGSIWTDEQRWNGKFKADEKNKIASSLKIARILLFATPSFLSIAVVAPSPRLVMRLRM